MSSNVSTLEEMQIKIEKGIISCISNDLKDSSRIRFWVDDERISDDEIDKKYPETYQVYVTLPKPKGKKVPIPQVLIGRNFDAARDDFYNRIYLRLETSTIAYLKNWGRKAATIINQYLNDNGDYALQKVRFDLIPDSQKENFIVPYLPLENIYFYDPRKGYNNLIDMNEYVQEQFNLNNENSIKEDIAAAEAFRIAALKAKGKL